MRRFRCLAGILGVLALFPAGAVAQATGAIQGTVVDASTAAPISGAQVVVVGSNLGALTNAEGQFQILNVPVGQQTIRAQVIGYGTEEETVTVSAGGTATAVMELSQSAVALEGIVVTALGIEREARSLGVAMQEVQGEDLSNIEPNVVASLSGKVAGVNITQSAGPGAATRIVLRGANSITGENEPLFIVDGIPIDNSSARVFSDDLNWGNAAMDIAPSNIESISVLKGPNAAALYGSRAANGAVIITTKSGIGARGGQITVSQHVSWEEELMLPDFQDEYGQGLIGEFEYFDGNGGGRFDQVDESWGPPLDVGLMIPQYNSPIVNGVRQPTPWVSHPGNVDYFFQTGQTLTTNASFASAGDSYNFRLSASRLDQDGMVPGFEMGRTTAAISGGLDVTDRLRATTSLQYTDLDAEGRPGIGYGGTNPLSQMLWFGRQVDIADLAMNYDSIRAEGPNAGLPYNWNYSYHTNPYYLQLANGNSQARDRLIGNIELSYDLADWLTASAMTALDWYQEDRTRTFAPLQVGVDLVGATGGFIDNEIGFREGNHQLLVTADPELDGPFSLNASIGANRREYRRETLGNYVTELIEPGIYSVENARTATIPTDYVWRERVNSILGQAQVGYNNFAFVTVTGRNDWSSTLPEENLSYFYPSVSGSLVFTDAFDLASNFLSYGKLRASWARVGSDADPYQLRNTVTASEVFLGLPTYAVPNQIANAELRPETTESWEAGLELGLLNDRIGLDFTYYDETTSDQIMPVQISRASGFTSRIVNAGSIRNHGVEVLLSASPFRQPDGFRWNTSINFSKNNSEVVELAEGIQGLQLGSEWYGQIWAREGEPYGQIVGYTYVRDSQNRIVVGADGNPLLGGMKPIGNYNPDWQAGWSNELGYGPVNLSFLLDVRQGGELYSVTDMWGTYAGVLEKTADHRCWLPDEGYTDVGKGNLPPCLDENGDNINGFVVPNSVMVTADGDTVPNTIVTSAQSYWTSTGMYANSEAHTFDASYVKLRQLQLTFDVPTDWASMLKLSGIQVGLIGRNLAMWGVDEGLNVDPETAYDASNAQGFEYGTVPTARSIGFNITVRP